MNTNLDLRRQSDIFDAYNFNTPVTVVGAGASGSWLVLALAKLGISNITVYDFDNVEEHNVPNQAYSNQDVGVPKVEALEHQVYWHTDLRINAKNAKYTNQRLSGIVFCMVDSMAVRKQIWEQAKLKSAVKLFVEPRMGLGFGRIYNVDPMNMTHIEKYEACWYSDEESEVSACGTSQAVITTSMAMGAMCAQQLVNFANGVELDNEIMFDLINNGFYPTKW